MTNTKRNAGMILTLESVWEDPRQHQNDPRGRGAHARKTYPRHHHCPPEALCQHHRGRSDGEYSRRTRRRNSPPLRSTSALPNKSPPQLEMLCQAWHGRRVESADGISTRPMKSLRIEIRSGRRGCESLLPGPAAHDCRAFDHGRDDQQVDHTELVATWGFKMGTCSVA